MCRNATWNAKPILGHQLVQCASNFKGPAIHPGIWFCVSVSSAWDSAFLSGSQMARVTLLGDHTLNGMELMHGLLKTQ